MRPRVGSPGASTITGVISRLITKKIWRTIGSRVTIPFKIVFSDGSSFENKPEESPRVVITYRNARAERSTIFFDAVGLADRYFKQDIDIDGDISVLPLMQGELDTHPTWLTRNPVNTVRNRWHEFRYSNRLIAQARQNAMYHYNRGTEMFRLFLDPTMTYTCGYWKEGTTTLAEAERDKLEHVCRKLRLRPGDTLVDVGSGWGSLLFHAYERYGAFGTNVSPTPDQNRAMAEEIRKRGLVDKIKIQEADFREVEGVFDRYASLGVYEHAGYNQLEAWIEAMAKSLKPGGIGLLHFIGRVQRDLNGTGYFIRRYIFPGGYLPGVAETISLMDKYGLEILDIENLRRHYAPTLKAWAENFDANWDKIHALDPQKYDEYFRRMWRFYLYACSGTFLEESRSNRIGLFQIVFSKGLTTTYPMTRDFLYPSGMQEAGSVLSPFEREAVTAQTAQRGS